MLHYVHQLPANFVPFDVQQVVYLGLLELIHS